ncbi:peroxisome assembly protein (Peroxin-2) [Coemansia interrupta]|uniref:RING-type E3 ubiquitin transferase (cysteine targeting) n=1 Tax=Coemansia interrupta TaxID=1126814 RepID=A0A9W8H8J8_9FUNG|nr:peroxisome assembly protein (Peroxin-2) [Coemansia interrupta]
MAGDNSRQQQQQHSMLPQTDPQQPWQQAWLGTEARLQARSPVALPPVVSRNARVNKLDADLLDVELTDMLREPLVKATSLLQPGIIDTYRLEVDTMIRALLFVLSVGSHRRATYGQALQNLTYRGPGLQSRGLGWRLHVLGLVSIGGGYAWGRMAQWMSFAGWADAGGVRRRVWRVVRGLERLARLASLANLLVFFASGQYRSVLERLLGLRLVSARAQLAQSVSFEFLNRQLVWHAFTEFVMFFLPLVNPARTRAWVARRARSMLGLPPASVDPAVAALPESVCAICYADATKEADTPVDPGSCPCVNAYAAVGCGHRFCYVCIKTRSVAEGDECTCPRCGVRVVDVCKYAPRREP